MKICTYNINSIKARLELLLGWLNKRENDIDILCLQELKTVTDDFPLQPFRKLGYKCEIIGQKAYNGVAVCSKPAPITSHQGFGDEFWDKQSRLISVKFPGFDIINIYAPHGGERKTEKWQYKIDWYNRLIEHLKKIYSPDQPLILVGDFNVAHKDQDVYSPEFLHDSIGTMIEEREAFEELLSLELVDVFRFLHPKEKIFTWWDYKGGAIWKNQGMRIDYILCTKPLTVFLKECSVDLWPRKRRKPTPSDHAPLVSTWEF
ncbi:MAG: exodeoxyribonuclease III [Acidobacteriota bacterium]